MTEKKPDWTKIPQKQDITPLTERRVKEVTKPWNKEKDSGNKSN